MNDLVLRLMQAASRPHRKATTFGSTGKRPPTVAQRLRRRAMSRMRYRRNKTKERLKRRIYRKKRKFVHTRRGPHRKWSYLPSAFVHHGPSHPPVHHGVRTRQQMHHRPFKPARPKAFIPHRVK